MSCYNYSMCKKASVSFTPPTQGNYNPGQPPYTPEADAIANAWNKPTPNQPAKQNQNNSNGSNDYANGMLTGVTTALLGGGALVYGGKKWADKKFGEGWLGKAKQIGNMWSNLTPENREFLEGFMQRGGDDPNGFLDDMRYKMEHPFKSIFIDRPGKERETPNNVPGIHTKG